MEQTMRDITLGANARLTFPEAVVIAVVAVIAALLEATGTSPVDAVVFAAGPGLAGAVTIRVARSGALARLIRLAVNVLRASSKA